MTVNELKEASSLQNSGHITLHSPNPKNYGYTVCNLCHNQTNLPEIHTAYNKDCLACHANDSTVLGQRAGQVIAEYDSIQNPSENDKAGCNTCHITTVTVDTANALQNSNHVTLHEINPDQTLNTVCNMCHTQNNLPNLHTASNWDCLACHQPGTGQKYGAAAYTYIAAYSALPDSSKVYGVKAGCPDCHPNAEGVRNNPASLTNNDHKTLHDPNPRQYNNTTCNICHSQTNLPDVHSASNYDCLACHNSSTALGQIAKQVIEVYDSIQNPGYSDKAGCQTCHTNVTGTKGDDASLANSTHVTLHIPNPATSSGCTCHANTSLLPVLHINIDNGCLGCHSDTARIEVKNAIQKYADSSTVENRAGCEDCHGSQSHTCVTCHETQRNSRRPVTPEFGLTSHHVAGAVTPDDCLACHNTDNHGSGTVYLKNIDGSGTIAYDPNNSASLNPFCLGCHDADSKTSTPFSDGKNPIASGKNWDSTDIETKYESKVTADSNKYPPTQTAPGLSQKYNTVPNEKKAYSAHGNPSANEPNGNNSDKAVPCTDCHNSHGSRLPGLIKTVDAELPKTVEDFCWNCHLNDQNTPNKASDYLLDPDNNVVRDYYGDMKWGENTGTGFKGDWMGAFTYKSGSFMSSHFYASKTHDSVNIWKRSSITCTDCHDPHGINPNIANANYMVPLLKGTWLVSPYKEDRAPMASFVSSMADRKTGEEGGNGDGRVPRTTPDLNFNNPPSPGAGYADNTGGLGHEGYFIDANTFGMTRYSVNRIAEDDAKFAGLCLKCHNKTNLKSVWGGHGVVKGWGGASKDIFTRTIARNQTDGEDYMDMYDWDVDLNRQQSSGYKQTDYHQFVCSKCHSPHASRLPRLMITNCIDTKGKHTSEASSLLRTAMTCHSTDRGNGWTDKTPWVELGEGTFTEAVLKPAESTIDAGEIKTLTFSAKNDKGYSVYYFNTELKYSDSNLDISNLTTTPAAYSAQIDTINRVIKLVWYNVANGTTLKANFDCGSYVPGDYSITKQTLRYKRSSSSSYQYGICNTAVMHISALPDIQPPSVPSNLQGIALNVSQVSLTWNTSTDNVGVAGYNIFRNGVNVGTSSTTGYTDSGLSASTMYSYKVSAFDEAGNESDISNEIWVTTPEPDTQAPSIPANLAGSALSSSQINLTWAASTDNAGVTGYNIFRNGVQVGTSDTTGYTDSGLNSNTIYDYKVSAYDAAGNTSGQSDQISVQTDVASDTQAPSMPSNLRYTSRGRNYINLAWNASTDNVGVTGYNIYRRKGTYGSYSLVGTSENTSYNDTGLSSRTTYYYRVSAYDAAGNESSQSSQISVKTSR